MTGAQIQARLESIGAEMEALEDEKIELEEHNKIVVKWSEEAISQRIRDLVIKQFGPNHDIKLALFKTNCEYNDQGYNYNNPLLILIKSNYEEVDVNMNLEGTLFPSNRDQYAYYEAMGEELYINDIKVKF